MAMCIRSVQHFHLDPSIENTNKETNNGQTQRNAWMGIHSQEFMQIIMLMSKYVGEPCAYVRCTIWQPAVGYRMYLLPCLQMSHEHIPTGTRVQNSFSEWGNVLMCEDSCGVGTFPWEPLIGRKHTHL